MTGRSGSYAVSQRESASVSGNRTARRIFDPLGKGYETWSRILSLFQDPLWRRALVRGFTLEPGDKVLDVACGTGLITRLLSKRGFEVVSLDLTPAMLARARTRGARCVLARAEALPFADACFSGLSFGYLLRYLDDPAAALRELVRVVQPGGQLGMLEFGLPRGLYRPLWRLYTRYCLPAAGRIAGQEWVEVGNFLGPSIETFYQRLPESELVRLWEQAGLIGVRQKRFSFGGGLVMHGVKP